MNKKPDRGAVQAKIRPRNQKRRVMSEQTGSLKASLDKDEALLAKLKERIAKKQARLSKVSRALGFVTNPVLRPLRRVLPPVRMGGGAMDLSPMLVTLVVFVLIRVI